MIPYKIFDNISITTGAAAGFLYGSLLNPVLLYVTLYFQTAFLETPIQAAKSILPLCCLFVASSIIVSMPIDWGRRYRVAMWVGWTLVAVLLGLNYTVGASLLGISVCSTVFSSMIERGLSSSSLEHLPERLAVLEDASQAVGFIPEMREVDVPENIMDAVTGVYEGAFLPLRAWERCCLCWRGRIL